MRAATLYKINLWMINEYFKINYVGYNLDRFWQKTSFLCSVGVFIKKKGFTSTEENISNCLIKSLSREFEEFIKIFSKSKQQELWAWLGYNKHSFAISFRKTTAKLKQNKQTNKKKPVFLISVLVWQLEKTKGILMK